MKNIEELKKIYIELISKLCHKADDYTKEKVKIHNKAMRKKIAFENELKKDMELYEQLFSLLLENENIHIQHSAAVECLLYLNINIEKSIEILESIVASEDKYNSGWAERSLKIWRGEIKADEP